MHRLVVIDTRVYGSGAWVDVVNTTNNTEFVEVGCLADLRRFAANGCGNLNSTSYDSIALVTTRPTGGPGCDLWCVETWASLLKRDGVLHVVPCGLRMGCSIFNTFLRQSHCSTFTVYFSTDLYPGVDPVLRCGTQNERPLLRYFISVYPMIRRTTVCTSPLQAGLSVYPMIRRSIVCTYPFQACLQLLRYVKNYNGS